MDNDWSDDADPFSAGCHGALLHRYHPFKSRVCNLIPIYRAPPELGGGGGGVVSPLRGGE